MASPSRTTSASPWGWPALREYQPPDLGEIAMPVGGIGTGSVSLAGNGALRDFEVMNRPAKGFCPPYALFAVWTRFEGKPSARLLEGPLAPPHRGAYGTTAPNHGLPRFRDCTFRSAYPFGEVHLTDEALPVQVVLGAFNPLIPGDSSASSLPLGAFRIAVTNPQATTVEVSVCGSLRNFIGRVDGDPHRGTPRNVVRPLPTGGRGVFFDSPDLPDDHEAWGSMALVALTDDATCSTHWPGPDDRSCLVWFWSTFADNGTLPEASASPGVPQGSITTRLTIAPGETRSITFIYTWHFPNRQSWTPREGADNTIGNHYTTRFEDAWDVVGHAATALPELEQRTLTFVESLTQSDLPGVFKEAALFNLSTLNTQTCFRTPDGTLYGYEGCFDDVGFCLGSSTHVWMFDQATPALFGDLARSMRRVEFRDATDENGFMSFRTFLPPQAPTAWPLAAADGQMGTVFKLFREWVRSGDEAFLEQLWDAARKALAFAWAPGGWDADRDGVMEGAQHTTYDVKLFGPNPYTGALYLCALRAAEEMATALEDPDFAATCHELRSTGARWLDDNLFNGDYYEQQVRPLAEGAAIARGLDHQTVTHQDPHDPTHQIADGCLSDQLLGQLFAHTAGFGHLLDEDHVKATVASILRLNHRADFSAHFNPGRSFVVGDEPGLVVCSYPRSRPRSPLMYGSEVWSGAEYNVAALALYEGLTEPAVRVVTDTRRRYDGRKRNPFDEVEAGHHYARSLASWGLILA